MASPLSTNGIFGSIITKSSSFLLPILNIMKTYPKQMVRTFALLLLVANKYDKKVELLHNDKIIEVVPSELQEPFYIKGLGNIEDLTLLFQNEYHDPSLSQNALNVLSSYMVYIYPEEVNYSKEELLVVFGYIAKELLQSKDNDLSEMCEQYSLDEEEIRAEVNKIKAHLEDF